MKNLILITLISFLMIFAIMNSNYIFAIENDISESSITPVNEPSLAQENYQNNECTEDAKCDNQSLEQLNNQNNQCKDDAYCINESISNIFVCEEKSLCLIQYEGPFELLNPY